MISLRFLALILCVLLPGTIAEAHKPSDSYLTLRITDSGVSGQWDIALRDLAPLLGLDSNQDNALTWGEVRQGHQAIAAYALSRLRLDSDGSACILTPGDQLIDHHSDGAYSVLAFAATCSDEPKSLSVTYDLLFDIDPLHRGLLKIEDIRNREPRAGAGSETISAVLSPERPQVTWKPGDAQSTSSFLDYLREGIWHIWIGFDHILFLVTLLLPAVLRRRDGRWEAEANGRAAALAVVKLVTAFTVAHALTLSAAALGLISLPSRLVESAIAASIVVAALNNIWPLFTRRLWMVAFGFGLIHGFGFASVLGDLGLPASNLALSLLGFNLGVEIGQLAIVAVLFPLIYLLRERASYQRLAMPLGSLAMAALAGVWLFERAWDLQLLSA